MKLHPDLTTERIMKAALSVGGTNRLARPKAWSSRGNRVTRFANSSPAFPVPGEANCAEGVTSRRNRHRLSAFHGAYARIILSNAETR
jgi:hypothetical protein